MDPEVQKAIESGEWKEKTDPKSGKTFYYNPTTKKTCWDLALELKKDPAQACDEGESKKEEEPSSSSGSADTVAAETSSEKTKKKTLDDVLKEGEWVAKEDPSSGKTYYYNKSTKRTCWDLVKKLGLENKPASEEPTQKKEEDQKAVAETTTVVAEAEEAAGPSKTEDLKPEPAETNERATESAPHQEAGHQPIEAEQLIQEEGVEPKAKEEPAQAVPADAHQGAAATPATEEIETTVEKPVQEREGVESKAEGEVEPAEAGPSGECAIPVPTVGVSEEAVDHDGSATEGRMTADEDPPLCPPVADRGGDSSPPREQQTKSEQTGVKPNEADPHEAAAPVVVPVYAPVPDMDAVERNHSNGAGGSNTGDGAGGTPSAGEEDEGDQPPLHERLMSQEEIHEAFPENEAEDFFPLSPMTVSGPHPLSLEQRELQAQVRRKLYKRGGILPIHDRFKHSDDDLIFRFLIAKEWKEDQAMKALEEYVHYRKEFNVENVFENGNNFPREVLAPTLGFCGSDPEGRPVYYDRPSPDEIQKMLKHPREQLIQFHIAVAEFNRALQRKANKDRFVAVVDLKHIGLGIIRNPSVLKLVKEFAHLDQHFYPENMRVMLLLNPPRSFTMVWKIVSACLEERTKKKMRFLSGGLKELAEHIAGGLDGIPVEFGGRLEGGLKRVPELLAEVQSGEFLQFLAPTPGDSNENRTRDLRPILDEGAKEIPHANGHGISSGEHTAASEHPESNGEFQQEKAGEAPQQPLESDAPCDIPEPIAEKEKTNEEEPTQQEELEEPSHQTGKATIAEPTSSDLDQPTASANAVVVASTGGSATQQHEGNQEEVGVEDAESVGEEGMVSGIHTTVGEQERERDSTCTQQDRPPSAAAGAVLKFLAGAASVKKGVTAVSDAVASTKSKAKSHVSFAAMKDVAEAMLPSVKEEEEEAESIAHRSDPEKEPTPARRGGSQPVATAAPLHLPSVLEFIPESVFGAPRRLPRGFPRVLPFICFLMVHPLREAPSPLSADSKKIRVAPRHQWTPVTVHLSPRGDQLSLIRTGQFEPFCVLYTASGISHLWGFTSTANDTGAAGSEGTTSTSRTYKGKRRPVVPSTEEVKGWIETEGAKQAAETCAGTDSSSSLSATPATQGNGIPHSEEKRVQEAVLVTSSGLLVFHLHDGELGDPLGGLISWLCAAFPSVLERSQAVVSPLLGRQSQNQCYEGERERVLAVDRIRDQWPQLLIAV